jgi:hypothetical protein
VRAWTGSNLSHQFEALEITMKTLILAAIRCSLMFTAVAALSVAYPAKANLITNGDFETGDFTGWTVTTAPSGSIILVDHGPGPNTTFGAEFAANGTDLDAISQSFATTPGATYTLTFFYQVITGGVTPNNEFNVLWNGTSVGSPFPNVNANAGFGTFTYHLQATGALTTLEFEGRNAPFFDFLDNVSVTAAVPDAGSTISLLGCALLGLAALRRRLRC